MAIARRLLVDQERPGFVHVHTRCVRGAFLCGRDSSTGRDLEHRREWIRRRMLHLAELFAIDVYAYAVMSNHYHAVLYIDPSRIAEWDAEDIARRWLMLCPPKPLKGVKESQWPAHPLFRQRLRALLDQPALVETYRQRLADLGWFMRFLNEGIARRANAEDGVTGRFWEGRFRSRALLDEAAVLTCMAYVDLNPIRAGVADRPESSDFTSVQARISELIGTGSPASSQGPGTLHPVASSSHDANAPLGNVSAPDYLQLLDWTGRVIRDDKAGAIPEDLMPIFERLGLQPGAWSSSVRGFGNHYKHAVGHWRALRAKAKSLGRNWLQGVRRARAMYA